ncbi:shikimate dehydrogenase [Amphritea sp.]|uniref:shikimate dehydrogenase family protein n=1 Tax=Amphritea sp. TaxID=1872502 RepID=UPI0025BE64F3|nr:shikimate dehydrogenase [Amphritea sp.]
MKLGLIGLSIQKSSSPSMHKMLGELYDLPISYDLNEPVENTSEAFNTTLRKIRSQGYKGSNVTYPFKQTALDQCDSINTAVKLVGATNTLQICDAEIKGFNTDYSGFIRGYRNRLGNTPAGQVLLIGAGGVGRAVSFALSELGATNVVIYDLYPESASSLADSMNASGFSASTVTLDELETAAQDCNGLVNCTPIGHYKTPGLPISASAIGSQEWAFDAVYTPVDTEFLLQCRAAGIKIISGFDLFFYQALNAFEIFTGIKPDAEKVMAEYTKRYDIISSLI